MSKLDDDDVFFALQNFQELYNIIKPKFSLGCPMASFMDIFDRFVSKMNQTSGVDSGLQQSTGTQMLLSIQEMRNDIVSQQDFQQVQNVLSSVRTSIAGNAHEVIQKSIKILPSPREYEQVQSIRNPIDKAQKEQELSDRVSQYPTKMFLHNN